MDPGNSGSVVSSKKLKELLSMMKVECSEPEIQNLMQGANEMTKENL